MKKETSSQVIIARQEHGISRKLMSPNALRTLYRLRDNGFVGYLVGGCVRDLLLGREPKDFDVVTNATPGEVKRMFRNCRLIGRRFRLAHLHYQDEIIEVATFRSLAAGEPESETKEAPGLKKGQATLLTCNIINQPVPFFVPIPHNRMKRTNHGKGRLRGSEKP